MAGGVVWHFWHCGTRIVSGSFLLFLPLPVAPGFFALFPPVQLLVKNGCCEDAAVYSDAMDAEFAAPLAAAFRSCRFTPDELCARVRQTPQCAAVAEDLCELLQSQAL